MSVSKGLKRLTAVALGIVALAAAGVFAAPYIVSDTDARLAAMRTLRAATGVDPQIAGSVYLTILPTPAVRIEEVRLADGKRPAFSVAAIRANVRLLPLFLGQVEIASLVFEYPHLTIEASERGAISVGIPTRRATTPASTELPEIRFENGTVQFRAGDNLSHPFTGVDAAVAWSGSGVNASGSFRWRGQPATFSLSVGDLVALERGDRSGFRFRSESEDLKLGFDGGVAYRNGLQADGTLAAETRSLRRLLSYVSPSTPVTRAGFGPFKLKAQLAIAANSASLTQLAIELDGNRAEGGLNIKQSGERAVVQATLATDHADLSAYAGGLSLIDEEGLDWSREPIDLASLDLLELDMRFSAARVTIRKTELARVAATASIRNGTFALAVGEARYHGGQLRGRAVIGRSAEGDADVKVEGSIASFELAPAVTTLISRQSLEGKGNLNLSLQGSGRNMHALTRSLTGTVTLDAGAGALAGINVEQVLRRLEKNPIPPLSGLGGGRTAFERLTARLNVYGGTARIEDARIESPQVQLRFSGETSVVHRDFNVRGIAALMRTVAGAYQPFEMPFVVQGSWESPYLLPDPTGMLWRSGSRIEREAAAVLAAWVDPVDDPAASQRAE